MWRIILGVMVIGTFAIATSCEKETDFIEEDDAPATDYMTFQFDSEEMIIYDNPIGWECVDLSIPDTIYAVCSDSSHTVVENGLSISWYHNAGFVGLDPSVTYIKEINGELVYLTSYGPEMNLTITSQTASELSGTFSGDFFDSTQTFMGSFTGTFKTPVEDTCG